MKKHVIKDERVLTQKRKIGSDAFQLLVFGLLISVVVQQHVFSAPFAQYAVELILFIAVSIYVLIRNIIAGNDLFSSEKGGQALVIVNSLVSGLTFAVVNTTLNYVRFENMAKLGFGNLALVAGVTFLCSTAITFIVLELFYIANKKKQKQIEDELNDNEADE